MLEYLEQFYLMRKENGPNEIGRTQIEFHIYILIEYKTPILGCGQAYEKLVALNFQIMREYRGYCSFKG